MLGVMMQHSHITRNDSIVVSKSILKTGAIVLVAFMIGIAFAGVLGIGGDGGSSGQIVLQSPQSGTGSGDGPAGKINVQKTDAFALGRDDAPVTIIEYVDFQCPFCRRHASATMPDIQKNYIDTGKVRFEFRQFPLPFHQGAPHAAEAFECAREQEKAIEVHDAIFAKQQEQGSGTIQFGDSDVKEWIKSVPDLDATRVAQCMDNDKYVSLIQKDLSDGDRYGVSGTPSFFIGSYEDGFIQLVGAQPFVAFQQAIEQELTNN